MTTAEEVAEVLRERILAGEIEPGQRMQQEHWSEVLNLSRTPIREAMGRLANQGLLIYEPNRGYTVRRFSAEEIGAAFDVRARLEGLACALSATHGLSPALMQTLRDCVARGDAILSKGSLDPVDLAPYRQMNVEFHETLIQHSGNAFISDFVRQCHNVPLASDRVFVWEDYKVIARSHDDHHRITAAIAARDAERADSLMREHVRHAGHILLAKLARAPERPFI